MVGESLKYYGLPNINFNFWKSFLGRIEKALFCGLLLKFMCVCVCSYWFGTWIVYVRPVRRLAGHCRCFLDIGVVTGRRACRPGVYKLSFSMSRINTCDVRLGVLWCRGLVGVLVYLNHSNCRFYCMFWWIVIWKNGN